MAPELAELAEFLERQKTAGDIPDFRASHDNGWNFILARASHFWGLWESAVKSVKVHLKRGLDNACLNSRPLVLGLNCDGEGIDILTTGNFLIGRPLEALPDPPSSLQAVTTLRWWDLWHGHSQTEVVSNLWRFSSGILHQETSKLETLLPCCGKKVSFPPNNYSLLPCILARMEWSELSLFGQRQV